MKFKVSFTTSGQELKEEQVTEFVESLRHICKDGSITGTLVHDLEIKRLDVPLKDALRELDSDIINEALDAGWKPGPVGETMEKTLCSIATKDLAEMYIDSVRENLKNDVPGSVTFCQCMYEHTAEEFLKVLGRIDREYLSAIEKSIEKWKKVAKLAGSGHKTQARKLGNLGCAICDTAYGCKTCIVTRVFGHQCYNLSVLQNFFVTCDCYTYKEAKEAAEAVVAKLEELKLTACL
jgi:hypothetical protein